MTINANSVNIKTSAYHHGDLRSALIDVGMAALDCGQDVDGLSLRGLARTVGVSATAVYRHFPDKAALLDAMALAALDRMGQAQADAAAAVAPGEGAVAAFSASGAAYVRFAIAHPAAFRLIWHCAPETDLLAAPIEHVHPAMQALRQSVAAILPADTSADDRRAAALQCWGLVHGLAMLALDRHATLDDAMLDRVMTRMARDL